MADFASGERHFTRDEKRYLHECSAFLLEKGYSVIFEDGHQIVFSNGPVRIDIHNSWHDEPSDIVVQFHNETRSVYLGWLRRAHNNFVKYTEHDFTRLVKLLEFLKTNFKTVTDARKCREFRKKIHAYIDAERRELGLPLFPPVDEE